MPRAGAISRRAAFQSAADTPDGGGGVTQVWSTQTTVWASLLLPRGREAMEAGRLEDTAAGILRVRKSSETEAITADWRAIIEGVTYHITSTPVDQDGRRAWLQMNVRQGTAS